MNVLKGSGLTAVLMLAWMGWAPEGAQACATCFGRSDSLMAQGMNMGILSLLAVIVTMLAAVASFFVMLARRAAAAGAQSEAPQAPGNS